MKVLVVLQGPAYGDERSYNGLRLAGNLAKSDDAMLVPEAHRSTLDAVTDWTLWADKTVTF